MRIEGIRAYRVQQPFADGTYRMSKGRVADGFDSLIVEITTDSGLTGWGEMAPLGNFYAPAFASGARAGVAEIAPSLLGLDPCSLGIVADGYGRLQIKVGGNVHDDIERVTAVAGAVPKGTVIFCDANAGWSPFQARQFVDATRDLDYVFEQPCPTIAECLSVRHVLDKPMVLDESVTSLENLLEIHHANAADGLTLKISRIGGISRTRQLRDLAVDLGFMVTVEDTGGAEIDTAAMAHLSLSTPEEHRLHTRGVSPVGHRENSIERTACVRQPDGHSRRNRPWYRCRS